MISIIDYGLGNVLAFVNVYKRLNIAVKVVKVEDDLAGATRLILPGVGAFDHAMARFEESGLCGPVKALVLDKKTPVLGICVGMQMLAHGSEEGERPGLGWIDGRVKKLDASMLRHQTRLPHMGWNDVRPTGRSGLFKKLEAEARFYFLHSYYFDCDSASNCLAISDYGTEFACAVNSENVYGVQFHPEKSHHYGTQLLKNFAEL